MLMQHFKSDTSMIHHEVSSPMFVREHETAMLRARVNKLESELAKCKAENDQLIFDLRITKTKAACLEEKLAQTEFKEPIKASPTQVNVTVHSNNYGCFGLGGFGNLKIRLDSPSRQDQKLQFAPRIKGSQSASKNSDDSSNVQPEGDCSVAKT